MSKLDNFKGKGGTGNFAKNPQNINRKGRPKKVITKFKDQGYTPNEIKETVAALASLTNEAK